jgi:prepilin-type N-terminal cleavage/methylation domain-containing protein
MVHAKAGFSIIEIMLVVLIIGILASFGIPRFLLRRVTAGTTFIARLNSITAYGAQLAVKNNSIQKVVLHFVGKTISVSTPDGEKIERSVEIPADIEIIDFYVAGKNQLAQAAQNYDAYFLINPDGIAQEISLSFIDHSSTGRASVDRRYTIELSPFTAQFRLL